jgi:hypothetical protein
MALRTVLLSALVAVSLASCAGTPRDGPLPGQRLELNPADRAQRTITNFTPALRCMDEMLFRNGIRDVSVLMEDMRDATQKLPLGARDMMVSAVSEMTRRSRAVTLSAFGGDQQNLAQLLQQAQKTSAFAVVPEYAVRGSISQLDDDVVKRGGSLGLLSTLFGVRLGAETKLSTIGFDAAVVRTATFSLVPGVTSKNTTVIVRRDTSAGDGQARLIGNNAVFAFQAARSDGQAQAVRNMVELAAIELVGKLNYLPYWQCLGTPDDDAEVVREVEDWFLAMTEEERVVFYKERLRERRWYDGAVDAQPNAQFERALARYREAMKPPANGPLDASFFRRFIVEPPVIGPLARPAPRAKTETTAAAASAAPSVPAAADAPAPAAGAPAAGDQVLAVNMDSGPRGVQLDVRVQAPGYVYCYARDPVAGTIRRIFPNRFVRDPRVEPAAPLRVPGKGKFVLPPRQEYACIHAPREVYGDLPPPLRWGDFEEIRLQSFEEIRERFAEVSALPIALARPEKR